MQDQKEEAEGHFPISLNGTIERGFGRGSKLLGFPTANIQTTPENEKALEGMCMGVYFGYGVVTPTETPKKSSVGGEATGELEAALKPPHGHTVHKIAITIGKNPSFKNENKTIEAYILHKFESDFYGAYIRVVILGFLHPMIPFASLDDLKKSISNDVASAETKLDDPSLERYRTTYFDPYVIKN